MQVIAFKEQLDPNYFPLTFEDKDWHVITFDKRYDYSPDVYFQINVNKPNSKFKNIYEYIDASNKPKLVCESTPFRRNAYMGHSDNWYYRIGWNHFLRCGIFNNKDSDNKRWDQISKQQDLKILPWRNEGDYILIVLQKSGDSTLNTLYKNYKSYNHWLRETIKKIRLYTNEKIVVRPHLGTSEKVYKNLISLGEKVFLSDKWKSRPSIFEGGRSLQEELDCARIVVGYNSNALVEAACDGIPVVALDEYAVTYPISIAMDKINSPNFPNRTQWLYDLSYCCWTIKEIRQGLAWNNLKICYGIK